MLYLYSLPRPTAIKCARSRRQESFAAKTCVIRLSGSRHVRCVIACSTQDLWWLPAVRLRDALQPTATKPLTLFISPPLVHIVVYYTDVKLVLFKIFDTLIIIWYFLNARATCSAKQAWNPMIWLVSKLRRLTDESLPCPTFRSRHSKGTASVVRKRRTDHHSNNLSLIYTYKRENPHSLFVLSRMLSFLNSSNLASIIHNVQKMRQCAHGIFIR